jgi:ubiquinone/menaquinone biosynthesis C-methylase UbiE
MPVASRRPALTPRERATLDYYNQFAGEWAGTHGAHSRESFWHAELCRFMELLPSGHVLEIGPGIGNEGAVFVDAGYHYTGVDPSPGLIAVARRRNPGLLLCEGSVYALAAPDAAFDGFWAAASLLHVPKRRVGWALGELRRVVRPGGVGFIAVKEGDGQMVQPGTGRFFSYFRAGELREIVRTAGFTIVEETRLEDQRAAPNPAWLKAYLRR